MIVIEFIDIVKYIIIPKIIIIIMVLLILFFGYIYKKKFIIKTIIIIAAISTIVITSINIYDRFNKNSDPVVSTVETPQPSDPLEEKDEDECIITLHYLGKMNELYIFISNRESYSIAIKSIRILYKRLSKDNDSTAEVDDTDYKKDKFDYIEYIDFELIESDYDDMYYLLYLDTIDSNADISTISQITVPAETLISDFSIDYLNSLYIATSEELELWSDRIRVPQGDNIQLVVMYKNLGNINLKDIYIKVEITRMDNKISSSDTTIELQ